MSRRALLVGINNFRPGIQGLRGCINDTHEMGGLLREYFGFQEQDIKVLHDADATAQRIREGLGWLLSDYDGDDVRVFHFSSHGTQVDDQGDDEWECLDEVIVTYDHDWDHPFRDDDLRVIDHDLVTVYCHGQRVTRKRADRLQFDDVTAHQFSVGNVVGQDLGQSGNVTEQCLDRTFR